jgi:hypothetical protein
MASLLIQLSAGQRSGREMTSDTLCRALLCSIRMTLLPRLPSVIRSFEEKVMVLVVVEDEKKDACPKTLRNFSD